MSDKTQLKKRSALGRGLEALLADAATPEPAEKVTSSSGPAVGNAIFEIPLAQIETNPYQPRTEFDQDALEELADSIQVHGIIQPITVRRLEENKYQLISGERRFQASKLAGKDGIPAYVRTANDQQMLEMALIENIQRENLNPVEIALSYRRLMAECGLKQEELGDRVGKKRSTVTNYLRLLRLPPEIQAALRDKSLSMGHARALVNIEDIGTLLSVFKRVIKEDLSVRKVEDLVRELAEGKKAEKPKNAPSLDPAASFELRQLQSRLSSKFETQVKVKAADNEKGEISIPYHSTEDLNRILEILGY